MDVEKICKRVTYIKNGLIVFDDSYENSMMIKGLKTKIDGNIFDSCPPIDY